MLYKNIIFADVCTRNIDINVPRPFYCSFLTILCLYFYSYIMSYGNCTDIGEYCPELGCQRKRAASVHVDITRRDSIIQLLVFKDQYQDLLVCER